MRQHRPYAERDAEPDELGMVAEFANLERGAEPDEEQRPEEALGDAEELTGQPAGFADGRDHQAERESRQHDRHVGGHRERGEPEEDEQADPQFQGEAALARVVVQPLAHTPVCRST